MTQLQGFSPHHSCNSFSFICFILNIYSSLCSFGIVILVHCCASVRHEDVSILENRGQGKAITIDHEHEWER